MTQLPPPPDPEAARRRLLVKNLLGLMLLIVAGCAALGVAFALEPLAAVALALLAAAGVGFQLATSED